MFFFFILKNVLLISFDIFFFFKFRFFYYLFFLFVILFWKFFFIFVNYFSSQISILLLLFWFFFHFVDTFSFIFVYFFIFNFDYYPQVYYMLMTIIKQEMSPAHTRTAKKDLYIAYLTTCFLCWSWFIVLRDFLYLAILLAIVILWRPTSNNTRFILFRFFEFGFFADP